VNVSVGVVEGRDHIEVELQGVFRDASGKQFEPGHHRLAAETELHPVNPDSSSFALPDVTIGVGFHWQRNERQVFRGGLRILRRNGLTAINEVGLEEYVTSVISSEMSAGCPIELLKAHAVISRSWLLFPKANPERAGAGNFERRDAQEITRWYGREAHRDFDVCADDHCQRYQGITRTFSAAASQAVGSTRSEVLLYEGKVCDARFSKCCGGITERYRSAWDDWDVPYLPARFDSEDSGIMPDPAEWILNADAPAYCNTRDRQLLAQILPGFDLETQDFFRWKVVYTPSEVRDLVRARLGVDLGVVSDIEPLERGPSGRIVRLRLVGSESTVVVGKELEIRRALSRSHLYSSAFVVERDGDSFVLHGAGWGHGVGLCQIGAAVMASRGKGYKEILGHYYPGAVIREQGE
jgi:stage II sporulation protein D